MEDQTRSLSEVAGLMGVSDRTIRRWIKAGKLKAYKPGRDYRIPETGLRAFIEESEISPKVLASPFQLETRPEEQRTPLVAMTETLLDRRKENLQAAKQSDLNPKRAEEIALEAQGVFSLAFGVYLYLDPEGREQKEPGTAEFLAAFEEFCASVSEVLQAAATKESKATERNKLLELADGWKKAA